MSDQVRNPKDQFSHNEANIDMLDISMTNFDAKQNQSRTNGPINAHLTIAYVMSKYNHKNEKQEALL